MKQKTYLLNGRLAILIDKLDLYKKEIVSILTTSLKETRKTDENFMLPDETR